MNTLATINLDMLQPGYITVHAVQDDKLSRQITANLLSGGTAWTIPSGALMTIRYSKPDGTAGYYDSLENGGTAYTVASSRQAVTITLVQQALSAAGNVNVQLTFYNSSGAQLSSFGFRVDVEAAAYTDKSIVSSDYYNILTATMTQIAQDMAAWRAGYGAPLTATTAAGMTDQTKIYVYTGTTSGTMVNGHWYYYNGTAWTDGGVYNSTAFETDPTLTISGAAADAKATGDAVGGLKNTLTTVRTDAFSPFLYNGFRKDGNGFYQADGSITENANWQYCSDFIPVAPDTDYSCWGYTTYMANMRGAIIWYTIDKKIISRAYASGALTSPSNAYYAKVSINNASNYVMFITGTTNPIFYIPYSVKLSSRNDNAIEKSVENVSGAMLPIRGATFEYTDILFTEEAGYINRYGILESGNNWKHAEIDVEGGATYYFTGASASQAMALYIFDDYHLIKTIPETAGAGTYAQIVVMPANAKRIIINKNSSGIVLKKAISLSLSSESNDWLKGKKLYCGGDSITEGANVGTLPNGYKKTYGGYTATRNGMTYVADGVGGSTMGKCTIDGSVHNNFITSRYQNIPTDADFITLWFGWNDNAYGWKSARDAYCVDTYGTYYSALTAEQQTAVDSYKTWRQWAEVYAGSINSTDINTWSGAWNTVLTWLLNNCPSAHIGVVIAYGMLEILATSLISICEKYGVSYVKAYDPHEFFSVGHSDSIGTEQATKRKALYTLDNTHPNELGYELMSTSYEQFIRRM